MKPSFKFKPNEHYHLDALSDSQHTQWVQKNTAILVVHGIGNQLPLETLDDFGRGLVKVYRKKFREQITLHHIVVPKPSNQGRDIWFDNVVRLKKEGESACIDLYEYYWANYTEDKADWNDLNVWLQGVVKGAKSFYNKNAEIGKAYADSSIFFTEDGKFRSWLYNFFIYIVSKTFILTNLIITGLLKFFSFIPIVGELAESLLKSFIETRIHKLTAIIGDVAVYNVVDPKSKFYCVRRQIHDGAIDALKFLIEYEEEVNENNQSGNYKHLVYPSVIVAGHSLGSQVAYDAINKLNLLVNKALIKNYDSNGLYIRDTINGEGIKTITDQLKAFVTFGSPLDKIVFFLREDVDEKKYLRQQLQVAYHGFKQRDWNIKNEPQKNDNSTGDDYVVLYRSLQRLLDGMMWRNYYDDNDYVSGGLDFYDGVQNINCDFKKNGLKGFSHSFYWSHEKFYADIIRNVLTANKPEPLEEHAIDQEKKDVVVSV